MKKAVEYIVTALADEKGAVEVNDYEDGNTTVLEVSVAESDMGRLIGRQGRTVKAIRSLFVLCGPKA